MATISDIASKAGVSRTAVSFVLRGKDGDIRISPATRERIRQAAAELNYVADGRARFLRQRASPMLGVLVDEIWASARPVLLNALSTEILGLGKEILLGVHHRDPEIAKRHVNTFRTYRTFGVVVISGSDYMDDVVIQSLIHGRQECGPCVCVSIQLPRPDVTTILVDVRGMVREFIRLMTLDGRRHLVCAGWGGRTFDFLAGMFGEELKSARPMEGEVLRLPAEGDEVGEKGREMIQARRGKFPMGILTSNDADAVVITQALMDMGIRVPEEVAIVSYGSPPLMAIHCRPPITAFDSLGVLPAMARKAVEIIAQDVEANGMAREEHRFLPPLVVRKSFVPRP